MLRYRINQVTNPTTKEKGYAARAVINQTLDLDDLAAHMNNHNVPFSKGTIKGLISDMVACITELGLQGNAVKIPDLGIFSIGLQSSICKDLNDWSTKKYVKTAVLNCRATGDARPIQLSGKVQLQEATDYESPLPKTDGGTTSGGTTSGSDSGTTTGGDTGTDSGSSTGDTGSDSGSSTGDTGSDSGSDGND